MVNTAYSFLRAHGFWILIASIVMLEVAALYYQYVLDYLPCTMCIHVRVWLVGLLVATLFAWWAKSKSWFSFSLVPMLVFEGILVERSWQLLSTERGWSMGSCSMDLGFPAGFQPDVWLPSVFEALEPCGYTPFVIMRFSMAEMLLAYSLVATLITVFVLAMALRNIEKVAD